MTRTQQTHRGDFRDSAHGVAYMARFNRQPAWKAKGDVVPVVQAMPPCNPDVKVKQCSRCREKKDASEFYPCAENPDGLQYGCKACQKISSRETYQRNRAKVEAA